MLHYYEVSLKEFWFLQETIFARLCKIAKRRLKLSCIGGLLVARMSREYGVIRCKQTVWDAFTTIGASRRKSETRAANSERKWKIERKRRWKECMLVIRTTCVFVVSAVINKSLEYKTHTHTRTMPGWAKNNLNPKWPQRMLSSFQFSLPLPFFNYSVAKSRNSRILSAACSVQYNCALENKKAG